MTTIENNGGYIYIRQNGTNIEYSTSSEPRPYQPVLRYPITSFNTSTDTDLTVLFTTDVSVDSSDFYFICGTDRIIFDGQDYTFTFNNISDYSGLIQNGTSFSNGKNNITVQNIKTTTTDSILANNAGWVCQSYFGKGSANVSVTNCFNSGAVNGGGSGAILGANAASDKGNANVSNCSNSGSVIGNGAGGVLGENAGSDKGNANVSNCSNSGSVIGNDAGGISGIKTASRGGDINVDGRANIIHCSNSGSISGNGAGAAVGSMSGTSKGRLIIQNFKNNGLIGPNAAGLTGARSNALIIERPSSIPNDYLMFVSDVVVGTEDLTFNIIGTNLSHVNNILINDIINPASFVVNGDTSINVTLSEYIVVNSLKIFTDLDYYIYSVIPPIFPICFPAGTPVLTDQGIINIEKINPKIHTIQNKKIVAVTQTITNENHLVCIEKNALGDNIPSKKTIISNFHRVEYKGKLTPAKYLKFAINDKKTIYNIKYNNEILYNILMEKHETMSVNNMIVETLDPKNIIAKLYSGNLSQKEKENIISQINHCMKRNNFKKCKQICNK
jgi:hypothetical protein